MKLTTTSAFVQQWECFWVPGIDVAQLLQDSLCLRQKLVCIRPLICTTLVLADTLFALAKQVLEGLKFIVARSPLTRHSHSNTD